MSFKKWGLVLILLLVFIVPSCLYGQTLNISTWSGGQSSITQNAKNVYIGEFSITNESLGNTTKIESISFDISGDIGFGSGGVEQIVLKLHQYVPPSDITTYVTHNCSSDTTQEIIINKTIKAPPGSPPLSLDVSVNISISKEVEYSSSARSFTLSLDSISDTENSTVSGNAQTTIDLDNYGLNYIDNSFTAPMAGIPVGQGTSKVPVMKFRLLSYVEDVVTINGLSVSINSTSLFFVPAGGLNGITKMYLFEDSDDNAIFDDFYDTELDSYDFYTNGFSSVGTSILVDVPLDAGTTIDTSGKNYFVCFDVGSLSPVGTLNIALADVTATLNNGAFDELKGPLPVGPSISGTDNHLIVLETNLEVSVNALPTKNLVVGHQKIPMLYLELKADNAMSNVSLSFYNNQGTFINGTDAGVANVSLYRDINSGDGNFDETIDPYIGNTKTFSSDVATITIPTLPAGTSYYYLFYDIGYGSAPWLAEAQLSGISGGGSVPNVTLSKSSPLPSSVGTWSVSYDNLVIVPSLSQPMTPINYTTSPFPITLTFNTVSLPITLNYDNGTIRPIFLAGSMQGTDVSNEYGVSPYSSSIAGFAHPSTLNELYTIDPSNVRTSGRIYVDAQVGYYTITNNIHENLIIARRFNDTSDHITPLYAGTERFFVVDSTRPRSNEILPPYIDYMIVEKTGVTKNFSSADYVEKSSMLYIYFINSGSGIDSITVALNGRTLQLGSEYTYDGDNGIVVVNDLGIRSGRVVLDGTDSYGNPLDTARIRFKIDSSRKVADLRVYPSPYSLRDGNMRIGFQLSRSTRVSLKLFDASGKKVWQKKSFRGQLGYNEILWDGELDSGKMISSGVYKLYVIIEKDGKQLVDSFVFGVR
ncbi:hypothetical protein ACFL56_01085 [Candidatus Margulisiibacteriota bacterium]